MKRARWLPAIPAAAVLNVINLSFLSFTKRPTKNSRELRRLDSRNSRLSNDEAPLRSELFSIDQMREHGKTLAGSRKVSAERAPNQLLPRLADNESVLIEVYSLLTEAIRTDRRITPAGEWLLDNFYLIEEQIRMAKRHLPKSYSRALPRLLNGPAAGLPRVYDIARETIAHGDGRVHLD